eukprot:CAMPEP_0204344776 /NCGR_PEP_ID=MMETSP0469-20131031/25877_1 /ASSEMBLY_ACC=CAM_ASM_000384 /TAXON_ID=2969 /ORGANISM="Oxyrrhis marina" /LENGTH=36 /DNA_ID= /DNA_START= /DNA_END= /DNA_ORIENTATION=
MKPTPCPTTAPRNQPGLGLMNPSQQQQKPEDRGVLA